MSNLKIKSNATITITKSFDDASKNIFETSLYKDVNTWEKQLGGSGIPNNYLHKGQAKYNNDRKLLDHLNAEFVNLNGMVGEYYITTYDKDYDRIWGEDNDRRYVRKFDFMFFSDEMYEPDYSNNMFGLWADDSVTLDVAKTGFLDASTYVSAGDVPYIDIENGFTKEDKRFEPYAPKVGDYIKVKSVGLFYEVNSIKNRSTSLQGSSFWQLTLVPMKEENSNVVDDRNGEADKMREIAQVGKQRKEDLDLFDMSQVIEDEHNDIAFTPKEQPEVTERVDNKYDDITGQRGFNKQDDDTLLNWD